MNCFEKIGLYLILTSISRFKVQYFLLSFKPILVPGPIQFFIFYTRNNELENINKSLDQIRVRII